VVKILNADFPFNIISNLKKNFRYVFFLLALRVKKQSLLRKEMQIVFKSNARCHEKRNDELSVATGDATKR
jgi:hypothetical protein